MTQHVFVILKYFHKKSYIVVEALLDAWFQYECIFRIPAIKNKSMQLSAAYMLFAHWLFWIAGALELFVERDHKNFDGLDDILTSLSPRHINVHDGMMDEENQISNSGSTDKGHIHE
eukprot:UN30093